MHQVMWAIVSGENNADDIESAVESLLEPYSEHKEVEGHEEECYCVGTKARNESYEKAKKKLRTDWDRLRETFDEKAGTWDAHVKPFNDAIDAFERKHRLYQKPDPKCKECNGTGVYMSTSNPDGHWDWFHIGGRWTGMLDGYDPQKDPANQYPCDLCGGTGKRNDKVGQEARRADPSYGCNGCGGTGTAVQWPTRFAEHPGDIMPLAVVLARHLRAGGMTENAARAEAVVDGLAGVKAELPFGIVTGDTWHERTEGGWSGDADEKEAAEWRERALAILREQLELDPTALVVVVDCHS